MNIKDFLKPVFWVGSCREDLKHLPDKVRNDIGFALFRAQEGKKHESAKPLKGYKGAGVLEVVQNYFGNTYRAVYTVRFTEVVYVLHVFQKKSKHGIATPKNELKIIEKRLKLAEQHELNRQRTR